MLETVLVFTIVSILFEVVVLGMFVPPRQRLAMLGSKYGKATLHGVMLVFTLWVHWRTLGGSMTAFSSFLASIPAIYICQQLWGWTYMAQKIDSKGHLLVNDKGEPIMVRRLRRGIINYKMTEVL